MNTIWLSFIARLTLALALVVTPTACRAQTPGHGATLLVSAAASLTDAFGAIEERFEAAHPNVEVVLNLAGSSALREQILEGAPVDVFASADRSNMQALVDAGEVSGAVSVFAGNSMQIVVPPGNPGAVTGLAALGEDDLLVGLCTPEVPCGALGQEVLDNAGVIPAVDSYEPDVRALLTKVSAGELDVAITYVTDVVAAEGVVAGVEIPPELNVVAEYPIAVLAGAADEGLAAVFVEFVLSADGQAILADHGFTSP